MTTNSIKPSITKNMKGVVFAYFIAIALGILAGVWEQEFGYEGCRLHKYRFHPFI